jgi:hypothetical protein
MKKCLLLVSVLIASCSATDDNANQFVPITPAAQLAGHWDLTSKKTHAGQPVATTDCEEQYNWYQFGVDNASILSQSYLTHIGGNYYCNQGTMNSNYNVTGNVLIIEYDQFIYKYNIIEVNSLTMRLEQFQKGTVTNPTTIAVNDRIIETCTKVQ